MNPFNPSFGKVPAIFLDRNELVNNVVENLNDVNSLFCRKKRLTKIKNSLSC